MTARDRACAAIGWDAAVAAMRYEDGTPVEIISMINPYRIPLRTVENIELIQGGQ